MPLNVFDIRKLGKSEKPKHTQADVIGKCVNALAALDSVNPDRTSEKAKSQVAKCLKDMKYWLFHTPTSDTDYAPKREDVIALADEVLTTDLLLLLAQMLGLLEFEVRKDAAQVFGAVVRIKDQKDVCPGAVYVQQHPQILEYLCEGYYNVEVALNCGSMFRDCIRDEDITRMVLESDNFPKFFDLVEVANFEIASDAFSSFKALLTQHKTVVAQYLSDHYDEFFDKYSHLLESSNYVTRRQSLKLLGEMLMDKSNVRQMMRYVSNVKNLCLMMNLLRDNSRSIQYEAFHVFKVFVGNPSKPQPIIDILSNNREKLLKYLEDFHTDRDDDEMFTEEKAQIIKEISKLGRETEVAQAPASIQQQQLPAAPLPPLQPMQQQQPEVDSSSLQRASIEATQQQQAPEAD